MSQLVNVSIQPGNFGPALHFSQYDVGVEFAIKVTDPTGVFQIPAGATVNLVGTKPSGLGFTLAGTVSGNTVSFETTETITAEWGRIPCEVSIEASGEVIGTANLTLDIEVSPHPDGTIDGTAETVLPTITALKYDAEAYANGTRDGVPVTSGDPAYENNAKYWAQEAAWAITFTDPDSDGNIVITFNS